MLDNDPTATTGSSRPAGTTTAPDQLTRLQAQIEEQKARNELATLKRGAVTDRLGMLAVSTDGAPEGTMTVNEGAGALAPWLAGRAWTAGGVMIADRVDAALTPIPTAGLQRSTQAVRVLVVADRAVLARDVVFQDVRIQVGRCSTSVASAKAVLSDVLAALPDDLDAKDERRRKATADLVPDDAGDTPPAAVDAPAAAPMSLLGTAADLLKLLRTDYTVTATEVSVSDAAYADVVAGCLADLGIPTVRDGFTVVTPRTKGLLKDISDVLREVVEARQLLAELDRRLATTRKQVELLTGRLAKLQAAWIDAVASTSKDDDADSLKTAMEAASESVVDAAKPVAPAESAATYVRDLLTGVEATCVGLIAPGADTDTTPLQTALAHEAIHRSSADFEPITHLLFVEVLGTYADTITRRSVLGSDGRLHHVATANIAWMLHDTAQGRLVGGGTVHPARQVVFDSNASNAVPCIPSLGGVTQRALVTPEAMVKFVIVVIALALAATALMLGFSTVD